MNVPTKLAAFSAALVAAFGAAAAAGALIDPTDGTAGGPRADGHGAVHEPAAAAALPGGLASTQDGYTLVLEPDDVRAGEPSTLAFRILGPDGRPVRGGYDVESERELHLIVVRRDATGFQHLHPRRAPDGTWRTPLRVETPGSYRVLADFTIDGVRRTLGLELLVPGTVPPPASPAPVRRSTGVDGFSVSLDAGRLRAGREGTLRFRVTRGARPVRDLQPYLGARGHLVALRQGDLAYLHVHPEEDAADGEIPFRATFPSAGRYPLFLQFRTGGVVRTASLTVEVDR
ncbi:hypothetical protein [Patulibacter americanus]|uniref:hypothetical protein n=1 Tax=Patulibacter americanus TaxID=588672 RepID=UPI0003B4517D|nr:hypothetical protein [Patulibacter americanus]